MKLVKRFFEIFWQEEEELCIASWAGWDAQWKGLVELERRCQDTSQEIQMLNKRQDIFLKCDRRQAQNAKQSK